MPITAVAGVLWFKYGVRVRKIVIVVALESEFSIRSKLSHKVTYTGVGKVNAARVVTQLILSDKPDLILNLGTAGTLNPRHLGMALGVREVIERDMNAEPLAPRGEVPLSSEPSSFYSDFGEVKCATGDSFVSSHDQWLIDKKVDLVDMELFAIAKVADFFGVKWRAIKFASDLANNDAAFDWKDSIKKANQEILQKIDIAIAE
jgi:adenosylhomocysteine nucleosidase